MRILFVVPSLPWPLDSGGRIRTFQLLRELARSHEITLWAVRQGHAGEPAQRELSRVTAELRVFERTPAPTLRSLSGPVQESWFFSGPLEQALRSPGALDGFDLIHLDELCLVRALPPKRSVPLVVHHHKLDLELACSLRDPGPRVQVESQRWRLLEEEAARSARGQIFCCEEDARLFTERHSYARSWVVENGVDLDHFSPTDNPREEGRLLALGSLDYEPNARGLERFLDLVWPEVRRAHPDLQLSIVGRGPDPQRWSDLPPGVELIGEVEDARPWLARATALIVPLEIGGGTRLKIVEAAAMGCPVLSTELGAQGLSLRAGVHYFGAQSLSDLSAAIDEAMSSPRERTARARAAQRLVGERYNWPFLAGRLAAAWQEAAG